MNTTISYYDNNAKDYWISTVDADMTEAYNKFLKYVPDGGTIVDMGCGSGRDLRTFKKMGYQVTGLDASEKMTKLASDYSGVPVINADMSTWKAENPFDGIWCCASLLHLREEELSDFFGNLKYNLTHSGAIYISVKSGIKTGNDSKGRYMKDFTETKLKRLFHENGITVKDLWTNDDSIGRDGFHWINAIGVYKQ